MAARHERYWPAWIIGPIVWAAAAVLTWFALVQFGAASPPAPSAASSIDRLTAVLMDTITVRVVFRYVPVDPDSVGAPDVER